MNKKRTSLTLDKDLVNKIDEKADDLGLKRSQAIEKFLKEYLSERKVNKAVVLAGGEFEGKPDPMLKLNGKPVLEHIIEHLEREGIEQVYLSVGNQHQEIISHFGNGSEYDLSIEYIMEDEPKGTAGCLREIKDRLNDTFLMLNGDVLCKVDLNDMLKGHRRNEASTTIALTTISDVRNYGVAKLKGNKIIGFVEKPDKDEITSKLINAGVYMLEPEVIGKVPEEEHANIESTFEKLAKKGELYGYVYEGEWRDIGS